MRNMAIYAVVAWNLIGRAAAADEDKLVEGRTLYAKRCGLCHQERGFGANILARRAGVEKSLLENRRDLTPAYIRFVIRSGLNGMPPFSKVELTDAELDAIANYLTRASRLDNGSITQRRRERREE